MAKSVGVILAAAGQSQRMGMGRNKAYMHLQGRPILAYSLQFFAAWDQVKQMVVVTGSEEIAACRQLVSLVPEAEPKTLVVAGGKERQDSVARGLEALPDDLDLIAVHDGARPFLSEALFARLLAADAPAAIPALPMTDTVKRADADRLVTGTISRQDLYRVQTPQVFAASLLRECYARAQAEGYYGTDDAGLLEYYQYPVQLVPGDQQNLKITTPFDLKWAECWLQMHREE